MRPVLCSQFDVYVHNFEELARRRQHRGGDFFLVMPRQLLVEVGLNFVEVPRKFLIGCQECAKSDEGSHDQDVYLDCPLAI
jgi:hypothetical protein